MESPREKLLAEIKTFPHKPGVYLMKDAKGGVLYVGKAKDLQKRVKSYFSHHLSAKVAAMLNHVVQIDYIITPSEKEALILECNLIKTYRPRYNVVLRDDKNYPYLRIDLNEEWPRFTIVRRIQKDGARYFGPFASAKAVRETLRSMEELFPLRKCGDFVLKHRTRPCLNYQIKRCVAPCVGYISPEEYKRIAVQACQFLEGKTEELLATLERQMKQAAAKLEFERAAFYRDRIFAIKRTLEKQAMVSPDLANRDVVTYLKCPEEEQIEVLVLQIRNGYLLAERRYSLKLATVTSEKAFCDFLVQYYYRQGIVPAEIILPFLPEEKGVLEEWLSEKAGEKVVIKVASSETEKRLLQMANENLKHYLQNQEVAALKELKEKLHLPILPRRIEGFDISNMQGQYTVASMVVFKNGKPAKEEYRRFKLSLEKQPNDYAMMEEVLRRRYQKQEKLPDLLLIDGGKGQLQIAVKVLQAEGLDIPVVSIAKSRNKEEDKLYLPERKNPLCLPSHSLALRLLKQIRDEAHRFALTYYQKLHRQALLNSVLDKVPGIGPKRKALLWQHFQSLEEIKQADITTLCRIGLPRFVAEALKKKLEAS
jgi:excinuclease ABC subunit C